FRFLQSFCLYLQAAVFRKQLNRGIIIFASERDVHFCVINIQATVDDPLYYHCYHVPRPFLSAVTSVVG
uniref:Uncharacterized protein n=1 Tax=Romanomermis culicivorax TaxID=13658 RepID=A0A915IX27_ROMCU